jgi:hypothetical protein
MRTMMRTTIRMTIRMTNAALLLAVLALGMTVTAAAKDNAMQGTLISENSVQCGSEAKGQEADRGADVPGVRHPYRHDGVPRAAGKRSAQGDAARERTGRADHQERQDEVQSERQGIRDAAGIGVGDASGWRSGCGARACHGSEALGDHGAGALLNLNSLDAALKRRSSTSHHFPTLGRGRPGFPIKLRRSRAGRPAVGRLRRSCCNAPGRCAGSRPISPRLNAR